MDKLTYIKRKIIDRINETRRDILETETEETKKMTDRALIVLSNLEDDIKLIFKQHRRGEM